MNCVLEGNGVKVFGKAIQALSRIGDELWFDPLSKGLALRSVNSAHSAYACFLFSPLFFQRYIFSSGSEHGGENIKCKMIMKSVLPLFRCLTSIERNVELCQISIGDDRVKIQFSCRHGIIKTHNLRFQDSEPLQAVFNSHLCSNVLKAPARLLGDMVMHFPVCQEEITLSISPQRLTLRNHCDRRKDHMKLMYTEMSLHPDEFDYFQVRVESDITFCLKELRGLVSFAESVCLPVCIHFDAAGKPVCFSVEDMVLEATMVLATVIDSDSSSTPPQPTDTPVPTTATRCAEASVPLVSSCEPDIILRKDIPEELIPSSQGSPIMHPAALMQLPTGQPDGQRVPDDACATAATSPASSTICSLLFKALSSQQDEGGCVATLPVLACYSDVEDMEDCPASPSH